MGGEGVFWCGYEGMGGLIMEDVDVKLFGLWVDGLGCWCVKE